MWLSVKGLRLQTSTRLQRMPSARCTVRLCPPVHLPCTSPVPVTVPASSPLNANAHEAADSAPAAGLPACSTSCKPKSQDCIPSDIMGQTMMASLQTLCPPLPPSPQTFPWVAVHGLWQWAPRPWRRPSLEGKFVSWSCSSQEDAASHRTSSGQDGSCWHGCSTPWAGARWPWGWLMVHKEPGKHDPNNFSHLRGVLGASPSLPPS